MSRDKTAKAWDPSITSVRVRHGLPEGPFHAYRIGADGKTLAYTGDTEWVDEPIEIGHSADLLIAEAYFFDKQVPLHLDPATLNAKPPDIAPKPLIPTHMDDDVMCRVGAVSHECAYDGMSGESRHSRNWAEGSFYRQVC